MKKKEKQTFDVLRGFNVPDGEGEKRYEPGDKVAAEDFDAEVWDALVAGGAVEA